MVGYKIAIFGCLLFAFSGIFYLLRKSNILKRKMKEVYENIDMASVIRAREHKKELIQLEFKSGFVGKMEHQFLYSGLGRMFPFLTPELWLAIRLVAAAGIYAVAILLGGHWIMGAAALGLLFLVFFIIESLLCRKNYQDTEKNLLEFLNILGSYSITAGEVTEVCNQVSKYMDDPLKSVLEECYYEAQTSGNASLALLSMADKVEHPKFKEIIKNIEICSRYSADFATVVSASRKSIQDYLKARQEQKSLAQESVINMLILLLMLFVMLFMTDQMITASIWDILLYTTIGRVCMMIVILLQLTFYWKVSVANK
jgi:Flp pilus assembly protein TadB